MPASETISHGGRRLEVLEERAPPYLVFFCSFAESPDNPLHGDRHQQRHVADLARLAPLEHDAIQADVGLFAFAGPVAPGLDAP
jgi:hypothetical protein